MKKYMIPK